VLDLTLFFNLERISFGEDYYHFINIQGFVYGIALLSVISILVLPWLYKWNVAVPLVFWLGVYLVGKLLIFKSPSHPAFGGFATFVTLAEITLVGLTIGIAHALARALQDFEQAVRNITLSGISHRLQNVDRAAENIRTELIRSRRYHTPVSVLVVEPEKESIQATLNRAVQEVQKAMMGRYVITSMAAVLTRILRRTDMVLEQGEKSRFIIVSPETDAEKSKVLMQHIRSTIADEMHVKVNCAVAEFPGEALTFEELVHHAENKLLQHNGNGQPVNGNGQVPVPEYHPDGSHQTN
jgi:GGDEF domain-containing protein